MDGYRPGSRRQLRPQGGRSGGVRGRELGRGAQKLIALLPAALLAALVVTQTFADGRSLELDARAGGVAVAIVAIACRAGLLTVLALATVTTAALRALT